MSGKTSTPPELLGKVRNEMREDIFINMERETALNTDRLQCVVSYLSRLFWDNTILSANEQIDFITLAFSFFPHLQIKHLKVMRINDIKK